MGRKMGGKKMGEGTGKRTGRKMIGRKMEKERGEESDLTGVNGGNRELRKRGLAER